MHRQTNASSHSTIDLQLAVLRFLPTPVLVLSPSRTAVFANKAAEKLLGNPKPIHSTAPRVPGQTPTELGLKLLHNLQWNVVLEDLVSAHNRADDDWNECPAHEVDALVSNETLDHEKNVRILLGTLNAEDGIHFILSFEKRRTRLKDMAVPHHDEKISSIPRLFPPPPDGAPSGGNVDKIRDISKFKMTVFDSCNVAAFILSADEKFYLANKKTREFLGDVMGGADGCDGVSLKSRLEVWDEHFTRRLDQSEVPGVRLVREKTPFVNYRCGFIHAMTGVRIAMNVSGECLYDDDTGDFVGGVCWCRDIQEYSDFLNDRQQQRLKSHETICNLMPHLVWTTTPDGYCDWYSERWYEFTGMSKEESLGRGFQNAIHPDDLPVLMGKWDIHRKEGNECEVEVRYRRHDGVFRWMLARACPLRDGNGNILEWYGTNTDIHDLVMARIEAARNKLQILTVLAHAEVSLFSINKHGIITMMEGGMLWDSQAEIYNVSNKSSLVGKDAIEAAKQTQPGGCPNYERSILEVLEGAVGVSQCEDVIGDRVFRTRCVADLEHNAIDGAQKPVVNGLLGMAIDITDVKRRAALEADNTRLVLEEQAAKDSNRMKSQFLANMSHEMRTPTAGVIGMVDLLSDDQTLTPEQRDYVNSVQLSAKALLTIVNDILDFSKIESGRLDIEEVPFNISSIVDELVKLLSMFTNQKRLKFIYENTLDARLEVLGDPGRTRQVLSNLLTNALKFTKEGTVKLSVSATSKDSPQAGVDVLEVQFVIEDTGIGIEKHVLDKLFRPFSQGDSSTARLYGGTGLGLTISKNLASLMSGSITLDSTPCLGSKAIFTVPFKVSSWCRDPHLSAPSPLHLESSTDSNGAPLWIQPLHRSMSGDLLKQQISNSVTNYTPPPLQSSSRHGSIDKAANAGLTPEQRSEIHVLVVEDNAINQTIALKNIHKLGFPVTAVWNGREALSYLLCPSASTPRPSIILMDVQMPVMDGYEATRILRTGDEYSRSEPEPQPAENERTGGSIANGLGLRGKGLLRDIPVIAMTASAIQGDKEKCHEAGMDDYLAKPVEKASLEEMLVKWARMKRD